jgi:NADH-quinone oxidoreductase subunit C
MTEQQIFDSLKRRFPDDVLEFVDTKSPYIRVSQERFFAIMKLLRDDPEFQFDFLQLVSGVDYPTHISAVYHLYSYPLRHKLAVRVDLPRDNPVIHTVEPLWRAADWHERETFDLMGIVFEGHPDLRRILCAEDWEGHPLRKDYVQPEEYHGISNARTIKDDWYPKPDEDTRAVLQYKPPKPAAPVPPKKAE